jgi:FixJ family two-component response regulator
MAEHPDSIVYIVDDAAAVRDSLESLLRSVGQASASFASAREFLQAERPDLAACLVLDVRLPEQNGPTCSNRWQPPEASCRSSSSPATATSR